MLELKASSMAFAYTKNLHTYNESYKLTVVVNIHLDMQSRPRSISSIYVLEANANYTYKNEMFARLCHL